MLWNVEKKKKKPTFHCEILRSLQLPSISNVFHFSMIEWKLCKIIECSEDIRLESQTYIDKSSTQSTTGRKFRLFCT